MAGQQAQGDRDAVQVSHAGTQRHQHVHIGRAVAQRLISADVIVPADVELHRRRQRPEEIIHPPGVRPVAENTQIAAHAQQKQRQGKERPNQQAALLVADFRLARGLLGVLQRVFVACPDDAIARLLHGSDQRFARHTGGYGHDRPFAGEVDIRVEHALNLPQGAADRQGAVGAGHAGNRQFNRLPGHVVAGPLDAVDHRLRLDQAVIIDQCDPIRSEIGRDLFDAFQLSHIAFDSRYTIGAGHACHRQRQCLLTHIHTSVIKQKWEQTVTGCPHRLPQIPSARMPVS